MLLLLGECSHLLEKYKPAFITRMHLADRSCGVPRIDKFKTSGYSTLSELINTVIVIYTVISAVLLRTARNCFPLLRA